MTETTLTYPSNDGIHTLTAVLFCPEKEPRALLQILHGMAEHIGRYRRFAEWLTEQGILVFGGNHLGHGARVSEEDRGFFASENGWDIVARDGASLAALVKEQYPSLPLILFGHSMGSFLARTLFLRDLVPLDALILSGTGQMAGAVIGAGKLLGRLEERRLRSKRLESPLLQKIVFGRYNKPFSENPDGYDWISSLPEEVARYEADPDCGYRIKLGMFLDLFDGLAFIVSRKNLKKADKEIPILLLSGTQDPVGGMGKGVKAAYRAFCQAGCRDVSLLLYEGCRHEILNDTCRDTVNADLGIWLRERFAL